MVDLPAPDRPVSQTTWPRWPFSAARGLADVGVLPVDVVGPAQGEVHHPRADGAVADPVDQDEAAHLAVVGIGLERDGLVERQVAPARSRSAPASWRPVCSSVLTFTRCLISVTLAPTVRAPIFSR
jgi:hypothetical protein